VNDAGNPDSRSHAAWAGRPKGWPIELATTRFLLRSIVRADASGKWLGWLADAEVMRPLHMPTRQSSIEEIAVHIEQFDNDVRLLVGIFTQEAREHIGFYMIEVDRVHALASFSVLVGDRSWWGRGVVNETRSALLGHFFDERGIEKAIGQPLARNFGALFNYRAQGWKLEGVWRKHRRSFLTGERIDQYNFALLKEEWHKLRSGEK
jgi:[ribosomal protein S5]-alanine N-acetyltransferase